MLLFVALVAIVSGASAEPRLVAPDAGVTAGEAVLFSLRLENSGAIAVDGCAPLELERKDGDRWVPAAVGGPCDGVVAARIVGEGGVLTVSAPSPGEYRGVVAWGTGCAEGRPFALASCKTRGVARSGPVSVIPAPEPPQR